MADIELVIKIPKDMYEWVNDVNKFHTDFGIGDFIHIIKNGTVLPEGHGDLIDRNVALADFDKADLSKKEMIGKLVVFGTPTVIPADK